ncbi:ABC transporter substrate-binding protein [Microvirga tunisiensis]|nr:ABC transporter substrate-binding protein [Microvirga tunisiensis]MPR05441.1 hypothetical protein [Microvirga tunisiensis]
MRFPASHCRVLSIAAPERKVTIIHATNTALVAWAPSYLAEALGFYHDEGFAIERVSSGSGPASVTALISGSGTSVLNPPGELLVAVARGLGLKIIMAQANYQTLHLVISKQFAERHWVAEGMPIRERLAAAQNFKGFRCGITAPGSSTDYAARAAFKSAGLDPVADVQILPLGSTPSALAAMRNGNIDGFTAASPAPEMAKLQFGAMIYFSVGRDEIPGFKPMAGQVVGVRNADIEKGPDLYAALVRADVKAMRYIIQEPRAAGETLQKARYE